MQEKNNLKKEIYFVIGPTSSGKTKVSIDLAKKLEKAEIICCDSRQVFIDLNIGSGKVTKDEMEGVPHHLLDVVKPGENFTVVDYVNLAIQKIKEIESRGNIHIISGGTGFYIDALLYIYNLPDVGANIELRKELENNGVEELWEMFCDLDSKFPKTPDLKNNKNRLIRYLEIIKSLGYLPELKKEKRFSEEEYNVHIIKTEVDRKTLKERIYKRTVERLEAGMLEEFQNIIQKYNLSEKYIRAWGYEFSLMFDYLNEKINYENFLEEFVRKEYAYAKRQQTWFKRYTNY